MNLHRNLCLIVDLEMFDLKMPSSANHTLWWQKSLPSRFIITAASLVLKSLMISLTADVGIFRHVAISKIITASYMQINNTLLSGFSPSHMWMNDLEGNLAFVSSCINTPHKHKVVYDWFLLQLRFVLNVPIPVW